MSPPGTDGESDVATPIGVSRQAAKVPEDVRQATAALSSDLAYALLVTIQESGVTRYTWLKQELQAPEQRIVEALGPLHSRGLIERTRTGRESAYVLTDLGDALLSALQSVDRTNEPQPTPDQDDSDDEANEDTRELTMYSPL